MCHFPYTISNAELLYVADIILSQSNHVYFLSTFTDFFHIKNACELLLESLPLMCRFKRLKQSYHD